MSNEPTPSYETSWEVARVVRGLRDRARVMSAAILAHCDEVEMLAFDAGTGELRDSATHRRWAAVKRYVVKHWGCRFTLRLAASGSVADEIQGTLGAPDYFESISGPAERELREGPGALPLPQRFYVRDADVRAWLGVLIQVPGGRLRHVVCPGVRVTLIEPRRGDARNGQRSEQLSLSFGSVRDRSGFSSAEEQA